MQAGSSERETTRKRVQSAKTLLALVQEKCHRARCRSGTNMMSMRTRGGQGETAVTETNIKVCCNIVDATTSEIYPDMGNRLPDVIGLAFKAWVYGSAAPVVAGRILNPRKTQCNAHHPCHCLSHVSLAGYFWKFSIATDAPAAASGMTYVGDHRRWTMLGPMSTATCGGLDMADAHTPCHQ